MPDRDEKGVCPDVDIEIGSKQMSSLIEDGRGFGKVPASNKKSESN